MKNLPTSPRQLLYLALAVFAPLALSVAVICWAPAKPGSTPGDTLAAAGVVAAIVVLLAAALAAAAARHAIDITPAAIVVRHSVYTFTMAGAAAASVTVRQVASVEELGLATRSNGIAAFGYYSGWFAAARGERDFCAVSAHPVYLVTFEGDAPCRQLALSASPEIARAIAAWAAPHD